MIAGHPTTPADEADASLPCPFCGYDLRGATDELCSECGQTVDRAVLAVSGVPWAHRRRIGRVRAYLRTLRQFTLGRKGLRLELARPQDPRDARSFGRVTAFVLALGLLAFYARLGEPEWEALHLDPPGWGNTPTVSGPALDLALPWCAGMVLPPTLPVSLVLLAFCLTAMTRHALTNASQTPAVRDRAAALGGYCAAPLALAGLFLLSPVCRWVVGIIDESKPSVLWGLLYDLRSDMWEPVLGAVAFLLAPAGALLNAGVWGARLSGDGLVGGLIALLRLLALWLLSALLLLGLLPWCVGFCWIAFDSLR